MTSIRMQCECGRPLGVSNQPDGRDEQTFQAVWAECGTRYPRSLAELFARVEAGETVTVILPRLPKSAHAHRERNREDAKGPTESSPPLKGIWSCHGPMDASVRQIPDVGSHGSAVVGQPPGFRA